jgi:riboflavin biosynthesis pyrimidine reductase
VESEAWSAVLAVARRYRAGSGAPGAPKRDCVIIRSGESFEVVSSACRAGRVATNPIDGFGGVRVARDVPAAAASLFRLYLPLCWQSGDFAVGHLGQSLDGRIATWNGASKYVTGPRDILHIHRMRALFDAIIVGAGTVAHDDPRLTVRLCEGDNPIRVVLDTERTLDDKFHLFQDGPAPTLVLCASDKMNGVTRHGAAELVGVARGHRRHYVEGGGITVSRFLAAGCLDRLQVTVSPLIIGSGRPAITLPEVASLDEGLRPKTRRFDLGDDVMFECLFDA